MVKQIIYRQKWIVSECGFAVTHTYARAVQPVVQCAHLLKSAKHAYFSFIVIVSFRFQHIKLNCRSCWLRLCSSCDVFFLLLWFQSNAIFVLNVFLFFVFSLFLLNCPRFAMLIQFFSLLYLNSRTHRCLVRSNGRTDGRSFAKGIFACSRLPLFV